MLNNIVFVVQVVLALIGAYQLFLAVFGLYRKKKKERHEPQKSFAILVAAHNEEQVVGALIENLKQMKYPRKLYDIFVICDNCTDKTADIVREHGVTACERHNPKLRGKGYAIEWMLKELWKMPKSYDAIVMFDADNLVSTEFLAEMNDDLCNGARVIQGYLDTKNPYDSWVTSANGMSYWFCNRLWQLPRTNLNLANFLGGTGMCFDSSLLKEMGWGATSLVEDLEFTVRCIQRGINPTFNYDAKVYDEKPLTFQASARQRLRWMQGHFEVVRRFFFPLLWQGVKERNWVKLDAAIYTFNAYNFLLGGVIWLMLTVDALMPGHPYFTSLYKVMPLWLGYTFSALTFIQMPLAVLLERVPLKIFKYIWGFPFYFLSWFPVTIHAFFTQNNKQWSHTEHTRVLRLEEVQSKQAG
jgi:cellulose synthase/poly-beta-1,6-N-acetylglucosamine synthase-like glycosyltransferase